MRIIKDVKLDFKDVLIRPKRSTLASRSEVILTRTYTFYNSKNTWEGIPIMAANMDTTGTFEVAKWREFAKEHSNLFPYMAVSCGNTESDFKKVKEIIKEMDVGFINIDVANGYTESFNKFVMKVRAEYPRRNIIAGNVVTGEMVEQLILSGADIVKTGLGSGSVCTTRIKTGVGYPQLSAVIEGADCAHGLGGHLLSDGGCHTPGSIAKAFGAGADFVMLGGMLAGHEESAGEVIEENGKKYKIFYGMASKESLNRYSDMKRYYRTDEGKVVKIPFRGPISATINDILGGLRSACTYVGARTLKEISKRTTFVRVSMQVNNVFSGFENQTSK